VRLLLTFNKADSRVDAQYVKRNLNGQKGRQTAHVAMPYWMRDTYNGLTPPPNLEAEIFRQILPPSVQEAR